MNQTTYRLCQVVHPSWERIPRNGGPDPEYPRDYVTVRVIDTHGEWNVKELLSTETLVVLARLAASLERQRSAPRGTVHKRQPVSVRHRSASDAAVG